MQLSYKDFLLFVGETNSSIREKLKMEDSQKSGEKEYKEGGKLLRAFVLSQFNYSRIHFLDNDELMKKTLLINKTKLREAYSCFPLPIGQKRREFLLDNEEKYKDIILPSDIDAWKRIKRMGEKAKWGQLAMESSTVFDTDELFLDKKSYLRLFDAIYQSCII